MRQNILAVDNVYHVYNKSIAGFEIFRSRVESQYILDMIKYYKCCRKGVPFSLKDEMKTNAVSEKMVGIIAFCLMPTHLHLVLKEIRGNGIKDFMGRISNGYAKFFNYRNNRKGPLWESRFQRVWVENDDQLLHLTRYIHLNPVTAYLVKGPEDWEFSSYSEYIGDVPEEERLCEFKGLISVEAQQYRDFVNEHIEEQRMMAKIKHLVIEEKSTFTVT